MSHYRDPLAGLRSQIATKRGLLEARDRALPPLLRALLPRTLQEALEVATARLTTPTDSEGSVEVLTHADAALDEVLAAHEAAASALPRARECPDGVPDPRRGRLQPPWILEEPEQLRFRVDFTRRLGAIDRDADVVRWDDTTYLSRFRIAAMPVVLSSCYQQVGTALASYESRVRTSVPAAMPELRVRRATPVIDDVGRAIGLVRDTRVGDRPFDDAFIVDGVPAAASVLTSDVTTALRALDDVSPRLSIERGVAELVWKGRYSPGIDLVPDEVFAVVLGVRAAIERA